MIRPARLAIRGTAIILLGWYIVTRGPAALLPVLPALAVVVVLGAVSRRAKQRPPFWICVWFVASTLAVGISLAGSFAVWIPLLLSSAVLVLAYGAHRAVHRLARISG